MTAAPDHVDVVIVSYRSRDLLASCLTSLQVASGPVLELAVHVIDNDSRDGTVEMVRERFPEVDVLDAGGNPGFAVSVNAGLRRSDRDYVLLLNPDTEVPPETIPHLLHRLRADPRIGVVGPRLVQVDGSLDHACKRNIPSPAQAWRYLAARALGRQPVSTYLAPEIDEYGEGPVDALNGAFMLTTRACLDRVGGLDETYWMYAEDLEWCRRVRHSGFTVVYDGSVNALHVKSGSAGKVRGFRTNWHFHRSMWLFVRNEPLRPVVKAGVWCGIAAHYLLQTARYFVAQTSARLRPETREEGT